VPTQVEAQYFGHAKIVFVTAGDFHSAAVTKHGGLHTWGQRTCVKEKEQDK